MKVEKLNSASGRYTKVSNGSLSVSSCGWGNVSEAEAKILLDLTDHIFWSKGQTEINRRKKELKRDPDAFNPPF